MTAILPERPAVADDASLAQMFGLPGVPHIVVVEDTLLSALRQAGCEAVPVDERTAVKARALLALALTAYGATIRFDQNDPAHAEYFRLMSATGLEPTA